MILTKIAYIYNVLSQGSQRISKYIHVYCVLLHSTQSTNDSVSFEHSSRFFWSPALAMEVHSWLVGGGRLRKREKSTSHVRGLSLDGNVARNVEYGLQSVGFDDPK